MKRTQSDPNAVPSSELSSGGTLRLISDAPTRQAPYAFRIEGESCGEQFGVSLTRDGLRALARIIVEAL